MTTPPGAVAEDIRSIEGTAAHAARVLPAEVACP